MAGFIAAGCWKPGASFELAAPTQLSSCLDESWKAVSAHKELQNEEIPGVFDQKLVILDFGVTSKVLKNLVRGLERAYKIVGAFLLSKHVSAAGSRAR